MTRRELLAGIGSAAICRAAAGQAPAFRVGAAAVKITPSLDRPVYIAGYDSNRIADGVHDDLWARALVLDDGRSRVALVCCDLIGLSNYRVRRARALVKSVPGEAVMVATTHTHSGPDTLGLWGPASGQTGMDAAYMLRLETRIAAAVDAASERLAPAELWAGRIRVPEGLVHNSREPVQDHEMLVLRFTGTRDQTLATVVHYGGHPEVNKGRQLTSDFVHLVRQAVETRFGGVCLYLNGALGGMVTPQVTEHTWAELERVGTGVGRSAVAALEKAEPLPAPRLRRESRRVALPLENPNFQLLLGLKVLEGELKDGKLESEVWRIDLGDAVTMITIPGEILPRPALDLKQRMPGRFRFVVGMGNDELGYILHEEDFDRPLYRYERSMSLGKQTWPILREAAYGLIF